MAEKSLIFGYWSILGIGQPIRNLLTYLGVKFEDKRYTNLEEWKKTRAILNTDFPNLPYLIDGDNVITETDAIFVSICLNNNRIDFLGSTNEERILIAQLMGIMRDGRTNFFKIIFTPDISEETVRSEFSSKVLYIYEKLAKRLGSNNFLTGKLTMVDFFFAGALDILYVLDSDFYFQKIPTLKTYLENFKKLPELKDYLASDIVKNSTVIPPGNLPKWALPKDVKIIF